MDSYRPEDNGYNPNISQYNTGASGSYGQGDAYGYGSSSGAYDYTPSSEDYGMDIGQGFESGNPVNMSGIKNLGAIISNEVVAKSYLFMMVALFITAGAALTTSPALAIRMLTGSTYIVLILAELAIVWVANIAISKNIPILAGVLFAIYSYLTGMIFSVLFMIYTGGSLASVFFMCSGMFAFMAIYGMITDRDLSSIGSICMMGLVGIIIASSVNLLFLKSSGFDFAVSIVGVLVFVGLTAYDANKTKKIAAMSDSSNALSMSLYCAFELYLDFINLFLKLIRLFGKRK